MQLILTFLSGLAVANAATTTLVQMILSDSAANTNYAEGTVEYHCLDFDGLSPQYVRGTYGRFGYFEGAVDPDDDHVFHVNWYETASGSNVPTSGSATLTYNDDFDAVTGPYWSSGTSDIRGSYGVWNSTGGNQIADDSTPDGTSEVLKKCLFPGASNAADRDNVAAVVDTTAVSGTSEQGVNTLCAMPAGPAGGSWLGAYTYQYSAEEGGSTEKGNYGTDPFAFWGESGMGFLGTWHASTGDFAGDEGTNIYMISGTSSATYIAGFYCAINDAGERTDCFTEYYTVGGVDENANDCPSYYRLDDSLDPLYEFAATGSSESSDNSLGRRDPVILSIFFGCLSAVLMALVIFMCVSRATAGYSAPPAQASK